MQEHDSHPQDAAQSHASSPDGITRLLRRRGWVIVLSAVLCGAVAFFFARHEQKKYTATAAIVFTTNDVAQEASGGTTAPTTNPQAQIYTNLELLGSTAAVFKRTSSALGGRPTPQQVKDAIAASEQGQPGSEVISVSATWPNAKRAADIANQFTQAFIGQQRDTNQATIGQAIRLVQGQYASLTAAERLTPQGQSLLDHIETLKILRSMQNTTQLVHPASVPTAPSSPRLSRDVTIAVIFGLLIGLAIALALERFDQRLGDLPEIERIFDLPLLGVVPRAATAAQSGAAASLGEMEPFRMLRAHLQYFNVDREIRLLLITSAVSGEGKTTVATGVATAAAQTGTKTLLIEADLRRPTLAGRLKLDSVFGLSGTLISSGDLESAIQHVALGQSSNGDSPNRQLDVLTAGAIPPNPAELLESRTMELLLSWGSTNYELVVIDCPPLLAVSDSIPLLKLVDGVVIVSRLGLSRRSSSTRLRRQLESLQAPVLGVVINGVRSGGRGFVYGYGYEYQTPPSDKPRGRRLVGAVPNSAKSPD